MNLVVLCLAAIAMVAVLISAVVGIGLPWLDRFATKLSPRHAARLWLGLAALPVLIGVLAAVVSFLPAVGVGHDHCLAHGPHHPHLCPHHFGGAPGIVLVCIAVLASARIVYVLVAFGRGIQLGHRTSAILAQASDLHGDALVFPSGEPQAFVLGALKPRVHVSRGLLALGPEIVEPVLAHERVHAIRRDLLWRGLCSVLAAGHLPLVTRMLQLRLSTAQEIAADAEAAETMLEGRFKLAEALLLLARISRASSLGISFTNGDLKTRVHALLATERILPTWPKRVLLLSGLALLTAVGASHDLIHHGLETLLGSLS